VIEEETMPEQKRSTESAPRVRVKVSVEAEHAPRLNRDTCWRVIDSSLGSLWDGAYTVTLEEIESVSDVETSSPPEE
jgi:hypothetical protein